jgi:antitoxin ChpS
MTVPKAFIEQNGLTAGSQVVVYFSGRRLSVEASSRPRYRLADLMAEMPEGLARLGRWDEMLAVGIEKS